MAYILLPSIFYIMSKYKRKMVYFFIYSPLFCFCMKAVTDRRLDFFGSFVNNAAAKQCTL